MSPYPRTLSTEIRSEIQPYTEKMQRMRGGENFIITSPSSSIKQIEYWLRCFLFVDGYPRGAFRISRETPTTLRIFKRFGIGAEGKITEDNTEDGIRFALDHLLDVKTEEEAITILQAAREKGELGAKQFLQALEEWKRIMGREE